MNYRLTVIQPIQWEGAPVPQHVPARAHSVMHTVAIEVDRPLAWVKAHADEIASHAVPGGYSALWVAQVAG